MRHMMSCYRIYNYFKENQNIMNELCQSVNKLADMDILRERHRISKYIHEEKNKLNWAKSLKNTNYQSILRKKQLEQTYS